MEVIISICFILLYKESFIIPLGKINKIPYKVFIRNLFFFGSNKYILISIFMFKLFHINLLVNSFDSRI